MIEISEGPGGSAGGASARGASHIRRQLPNQDAGAGYQCGDWTVIAVSDGHGASPHFRSDRGARFAVESVHRVFEELTGKGTLRALDLERLHLAIIGLPEHIVGRWRQAVAADAAADPDPALRPGEPELAYGATCVAAAFGPEVSIFVQIGDGDLLAAAPGGEMMRPLPENEALPGQQTYSLCLPDAASHFRVALFNAPHPLAAPQFAMASSDGLSKSFVGHEPFLDIARGWRTLVEEHGIKTASADLDGWLTRCSEMGSGDDITLVFFHRSPAPDRVAAASPAAIPLAPAMAKPAGAVRPPNLPAAHVTGRRRFNLAALAVAAGIGVLVGAAATYFIGEIRRTLQPAAKAVHHVPAPAAGARPIAAAR